MEVLCFYVARGIFESVLRRVVTTKALAVLGQQPLSHCLPQKGCFREAEFVATTGYVFMALFRVSCPTPTPLFSFFDRPSLTQQTIKQSRKLPKGMCMCERVDFTRELKGLVSFWTVN
jgi:hypothetical protein